MFRREKSSTPSSPAASPATPISLPLRSRPIPIPSRISSSSNVSSLTRSSSSTQVPPNHSPSSPLSPTYCLSRTSSSPSSPPILLHLEFPSLLDMWALCQQIGFMYDFFIDTISATTILPTTAKIFQKNLMFKISEEALIIAREFAVLITHYASTHELGQRQDPHWSIKKSPRFKMLCSACDDNSSTIFGERLGRRLDTGEVYRPPFAPSSRHTSKPRYQGISSEKNDNMVRGIEYKIDDWNNSIKEFIETFDPYHPPAAVKLMMMTANQMRLAANGVIKIVEFHYRLALQLRPIDGMSEAEMVYLEMVKGQGGELDGRIKEKLMNVAWRAERKLHALAAVRSRPRSGSSVGWRRGRVDGV